MCYFSEVLTPARRKIAIQQAIMFLSELEFDTIVIQGISGATMGAILADRLNKNLVISRKEKEQTHSSEEMEYDWRGKTSKYVIIDDLVDSGKTVQNIISRMKTYFDNEAICVGFYGYTKQHNEDSYEWFYFESKHKKIFDELELINFNRLVIYPQNCPNFS